MAALVIVICFICFTYIVNGRDIASPSMNIFLIFLISLLFNILYREKWEVSFSSRFLTVLVTGFAATAAGDLLGRECGRRVILGRKYRGGHELAAGENYCISVPRLVNGAVIIFMLITAAVYYRDMLRIASLYGDLSVQSVLQAVRNATYMAGSSGDIEAGTSTVLSHAILLSKTLAYVYIYIFLFNLVFSRERKKAADNIVYAVPPVIYLAESVLSTSRSQILYFFAGGCMMFYLLWNCRHGKISRKAKRKFIRYGVLLIVLFCVIFYLLGFLTRKSEAVTFLDNISVYIGGSLVSLNNWLEHFSETTEYFGEETLVGIRKLFYNLGLTDYYVVRHLDFTDFGMYRGNVYTAFRRYLSDFGYGGLFLLQMLSTFVFSFLYNKIKNRRTPGGLIILYGYIIYAAAMEAIDELFFSAVLEISNIYILIYGFFIYKLIVKRNLVNEKDILKDKRPS